LQASKKKQLNTTHSSFHTGNHLELSGYLYVLIENSYAGNISIFCIFFFNLLNWIFAMTFRFWFKKKCGEQRRKVKIMLASGEVVV
jgi:hypothetical protein